MFNYLDFIQVDGKDSGKDLKLLALSTCSFCKRAKAFLAEKEIKYSYVDIDTLDSEEKVQVRAEFKEVFGERITFPALIINDTDKITGFIRFSWNEIFGLNVK